MEKILVLLILMLTACAVQDMQTEEAFAYTDTYLEIEEEEVVEITIPFEEEIFVEEGMPIEEESPESEALPIIFTAEPLPPYIIEQISGVSFHENDRIGFDDLSYLTITHVDFDGKNRHGHIIVAADIAEEVLEIFQEIFEGGFPIERMRLIDYYDASDYYSMADNNSVAFNFRYIAGTTTLSRHALGLAIDINPVQNPYIRGETVWPEAGREYIDRENVRPGMIVSGDVVYTAFTSRGWTWGGNWRTPRDYHHFERR